MNKIDKIQVDMDGVIADFEKGAAAAVQEFFGVNMQHEPKRTMWNAIHKYQETYGEKFWYNLEVMEGTKELFKYLEMYDVEILSAVGSKGFNANPQKIEWIREHVCPNMKINLVVSSPDKAAFACPRTILIDDRLKSINPWRKAGGIGIHHTDMETTIAELKRMGL